MADCDQTYSFTEQCELVKWIHMGPWFSEQLAQIEGPYEYAEGTAVGQCPGTEHLPIRFALEMHRNANGRYVTGEIESPYDFDEQIAMIAIAYKWANQGWKFMAKTESSYTCQHLKNILPVLFEEWTKNMNVSAECPVSAGPYEYAEGSNVGICPGAENSPIRVAVQIHRNANGRYISGEMESPFDFDDQFAMIAAAFKWANSGWKFLAKSESSYACHHLKTVLPLLFDVWTKHMNVTAECPIPAGKYKLNPFMARVRPKRFPTLPYGHFRLEMNLTRHGKLMSCLFLEGNIQPTYDKSLSSFIGQLSSQEGV